jgi:hypothetical protein
VKAFKCDRCRKFFEQTGVFNQEAKREVSLDGLTKDVCRRCFADIERFVKEPPPEAA